ncbi:hypothetical protein [Shewanella youngdeokensis]|uniref:DUF3108 domain-containing protein n=1 Tax=Shewanella youngdeokensis TaxID=2999068 RepID=A0ABZ0JYP4_9GAMM|nr:hypothetical protein RGE70_15625 [Shewanella sp. DAU334]
MKFFKLNKGRRCEYTGKSVVTATSCANIQVGRSWLRTNLAVITAVMLAVIGHGAVGSQQVFANETALTAMPPVFVECTRTANYNIYLSGLHTGTMARTEDWRGSSAVITTHSEASILGIGTEYFQQAKLYWSTDEGEWLTDKFHQIVSGFRSRNMQVSFSANGRASHVDIDGDVARYTSTDIALRDVDTLAVQIRQYLLQGRQQFALHRQASDGIEPYQYHVKPPQTVKIEPWGELNVIPVKQTGAEEVTYYYAPSMGFQLVKARYHGFILRGLVELSDYNSSCD